VLCNRLHPTLLLLIGGGACLLGYGTARLLDSGVAPALPYWMLQQGGEGRSFVCDATPPVSFPHRYHTGRSRPLRQR
jgi:hypothetical protein